MIEKIIVIIIILMDIYLRNRNLTTTLSFGGDGKENKVDYFDDSETSSEWQ